MSVKMEGHPATDDSPSPSALTLVGLLGSLVTLLLVGVIVAVGWGAGGDNAANDSRSATAGLPDLAQELSAQLWVLDRSDSSIFTNDENPVSLSFHEQRLTGLGPCNAYWARFTLDEDDESLQVTNLRHSARECSAITMRAEREYFATLRSVRDIDLDDREHLVLSNAVGDRLSFDGYDTYDEIAKVWNIRQIGGRDGLDTPLVDTHPLLSFSADDDNVALHTGCNSVRSTWALIDDRLEFGSPGAQTLKSCDEPDGLGGQETALLRVLGPGVRAHVAPGRLVMLDRFNHVLVVATNATPGSS